MSDQAEQFRIETLQLVAQFSGKRDSGEIERAFLEQLSTLCGTRKLRLYVVESAGDTTRPVEVLRMGSDALGAISWNTADLARTAPKVVLDAIERDALTVRTIDGESCVVVPFGARNRAAGCVQINAGSGPIALLPVLARVFADCLALAHAGERDQLTGLLNRRTFEHRMLKLLTSQREAQVAQASHPLEAERRDVAAGDRGCPWIAVLDIDFFKRINDTYGHIIGDEVIVLLANQLRSSLRREDLAFRFGGEEFVVVLSPCTLERAREAFERLRAAQAARQFMQVGSITVSIGFTRLEPTDFGISALERADRALYCAKDGGRNRVCFFDELVEQGMIVDPAATGEAELFI